MADAVHLFMTTVFLGDTQNIEDIKSRKYQHVFGLPESLLDNLFLDALKKNSISILHNCFVATVINKAYVILM